MFDDLLVSLEEFTDFKRQVQGAIPVQYMNIGALVGQVVSYDHLRGGKVKGGVNGEKDDANWVSVDVASPLKYVICAEEEGGVGVSAI